MREQNQDSLRGRLRFEEFEIRRSPSGRATVRVVLGGQPGESFVGTSEDVSSPPRELRCAAAAMLQAIEHAMNGQASFELIGVKSVQAFDAVVVIASLSSRESERKARLVGSSISDDFSPRDGAVAILHATNRLVERFLAGPPPS